MKPLAETGIFRSASEDTLEIIKTLNTTQQYTFLIPTRFICYESGQVGYLLDEYFNWGREKDQRICYRTFFGNSRFEALQGAVKIARFHWHKKAVTHPKSIFLCDPTLEIKHLIDPLGRGETEALIPGIKVVATLDEVNRLLDQGENPLAVVVCTTQEMSAAIISDLFRRCQQQKIFTIFEHADLDLTSPTPIVHSITPLPDIIVTGESLTNYEIPCGAFSMAEHVHKPWSSMENCFIHSSTYAGNRLALIKMRENLLRHVPFFTSNSEVYDQCAKIAQSDAERLNAFARYINPGIVKLYKLMGLDVNPIRSHGSQLTVRTKENTEKTVLDCVAGGGAVIRGHTPEDIVPEVIALHDKQTNYWDSLKKRFVELTSFQHFFPAISGATAVDIAISVALLANKDKTQVVTFKDNYGGKTLLSLTVSADEMWRTPFFPLYHDVTYIDPFASDAEKQLTTVLTSGKVALVWFEIYQGGTEKEIPHNLLEIIASYKQEYNYIVGVDEILMGFFRMGKLFSHTNTPVSPDIVTLAKALCDGTFPTAMTLVSGEVYQRALNTNPDAVRYYEKLYVNQLGSHIGLHCIDKLLTTGMEEHANRIADILQKGFAELSQNSPFLQDVVGKGFSYRLHYKYDNPLVMFFWSYLCLTQANTFLFFDRCGPPALTLTEEEAELLLNNLRKVFYGGKVSTYSQFFLYLLKAIVLTLLV